MIKNQIRITITGPGTQISLFILDDLFLKKLIENSKSNVDFNCYEFLNDSGIECHHICDGIDVLFGESEITFSLNGKSVAISSVVDLDDIESEEDRKKITENCFVYDNDSIKDLDGSIPKGNHAIIMEDYFKNGQLETFFEVNSIPKPQDLKLEFVNLDTPSDFSDCTYKLGSNDFGYDVRSISYEGESYYFGFSCLNHKYRRYYLASRNSAGYFEISHLNEELFE